jgi:hypothetical protein
MSNQHQTHYDAISIALDAFKAGEPFEGETYYAARKRLEKSALRKIALTREVATAASNAQLLAECDHSQQEVDQTLGKSAVDRCAGEAIKA